MWISRSGTADQPKWEMLFLWVTSQFESIGRWKLQDTKRWKLVTTFPSLLYPHQRQCQSTFRYYSTTFCCQSRLLSRANTPAHIPQPSLYIGSQGMVSAKWDGSDGEAVVWPLLFISLVSEMVVHNHSQSSLIFALFGTKEWVSLVYYLKIDISKKQAWMMSKWRCFLKGSCRY